jgi:SAM-dependent methyltransferase
VEKADPDRFYRLLAKDSIRQVERHLDLENKLVLDVGGGAGYFTNAFRDAGARCVLIEPDLPRDGAKENLDTLPSPLELGAVVIGDGFHLPFAESTADVCFSSNVLEHVRDPRGFIAEMVRVTKPGGIIYVAYTNWYSPWGGHGTSPWHYLGGERALQRFIRVKGRAPINRYGENLFAVHVGSILRWARGWPAVQVLEATPRYYPDWCRWVVDVPGLREIATWNLMLILRRIE